MNAARYELRRPQLVRGAPPAGGLVPADRHSQPIRA